MLILRIVGVIGLRRAKDTALRVGDPDFNEARARDGCPQEPDASLVLEIVNRGRAGGGRTRTKIATMWVLPDHDEVNYTIASFSFSSLILETIQPL
jgi:hypothetical protein